MTIRPTHSGIQHTPIVSATFPPPPSPSIMRDHLLTAIDKLLEQSVDCVVLAGEEGIGKTTLAAHFAQAHANRALCIFADGPGALVRSPEFLLSDLCDQVSFIQYGKRFSTDQDQNSFLRKEITSLIRKANSSSQPYYVILDGLLTGQRDDSDLLAASLSQFLPLQIRGFKYVLTGTDDTIHPTFKKVWSAKPLYLTGFSLEETRAYLSDLGLAQERVNELHRLFRGVPGKLASARRILQRDSTALMVRNHSTASYEELYEMEWSVANKKEEHVLELLAYIAHSHHALTAKQLALLCGNSHADVLHALSELKFLFVDENSDTVSFVSSAFKDFASRKLSGRRATCWERLIDMLMLEKESLESVELLPTYLKSAGRSAEVISYLTPDYLSSVCDRFHSLRPAKEAIRSGLHIAEELDLPIDALSFSLQQSLLSQLETAPVQLSEVDARLAVEDVNSALSLASDAFLIEDRLQMWARIIRHQHDSGVAPDHFLCEEVRQLAATVSFEAWPERALRIAEDLIASMPEVAMSIVEKAATEKTGGGLDLALARLSLRSSDKDAVPSLLQSKKDAIVNRISRKALRQFVHSAAILTSSLEVEAILKQCAALSNPEDALFLLEHWCVENKRQDDAWKACDHGVNLILRESSYTPTARTVRRLCSPLPFCAPAHPSEVNTLLQQVDAQRATLLERGPAVECIRLLMCLAEIASTWDPAGAKARLEECYFIISDMSGPARLEALGFWGHYTQSLNSSQVAGSASFSAATLLRRACYILAFIHSGGRGPTFGPDAPRRPAALRFEIKGLRRRGQSETSP